MLHASHHTLISTVAALSVLVTAAHAGPLQLHPKAERLPFDHQGPFVTTGDGGILAVGTFKAYVSRDEGKTWQAYPLFEDQANYETRSERALLRTRDGVVVLAWLNERELRKDRWGAGGETEASKWALPTYVSRSLDDGKTWQEPVKIQDRWCGAIRCLVELKNGRLVLVGQKVVPWRHVTLTYVSDDQGKTWKPSNAIDLGGYHDHDGAMEGTLVERKDGSLYMLIRTTKGSQYEAVSRSRGLTWEEMRTSGIASSTSPATLTRLSNGHIALVWNRAPAHAPGNPDSREELSIAFSSDEAKTWSKPTVVAARYEQPGESFREGRVAYPYLYERAPGQLWITTMQGGLRMRIARKDCDAGHNAIHSIRPWSIAVFGDSTTAPRSGVSEVYGRRVCRMLGDQGIPNRVINAGVAGDTTERARKRLEKDVLAHRPDLVVIQFGANDATIDVWKNPPTTKPRVSAKHYQENLRYMIGELSKRNVTVILMTPSPLRWTTKLKTLYGKSPYDPDDPNSLTDTMLRKYIDLVRGVAKEEGVRLVDVFAAYDKYESQTGESVDSLLLDGIHPNDRGHELVAEQLLPAIRSELERLPP